MHLSVFPTTAQFGMYQRSHKGQTTTFSTEVQNITNHLGCAIYTIDDTIPGDYPKTLTLDFGTGCTSADGIIRSGKIVYVFSAPFCCRQQQLRLPSITMW